MMDNEKQFEDFIRDIEFDDTADRTHRDKLEQDLLAAIRNLSRERKERPLTIWRTIMKSPTRKLAAAVIIMALVLSYFVFEELSSPAWALSETIKALRDFGAVHIVGTVMDEYGAQKGCEIWMRADKSLTFSKDTIARIDNGVILWVEDGSTYTYIPQNNTVYYENAVTAGITQWPGPAFFELFAHAEGTETIRATDSATGREQVTLLGSLISNLGPQSYSIKFDVKTKLPIELAQWNNMERRGAPFFRARQITYCEDLPDSIFKVEYPKDAHRVEKELTIPESSVGLLSNPQCGIPTEDLSKQEAAYLIIRRAYQAMIDEDFNEFRRLCPAAATWSDEFLRYVVHGGEDPQQRVVEIVRIGSICKEGHSKLGPIVAVPCVVKTKGGTMREDKMIVQFRNIGGKSSCVLHGPYGLPREIQ